MSEPTGVTLQCGWGRLVFGHTFPTPRSVAECILDEESGKRDIAFYLNDPHIVLNEFPQEVFLDPSNTYRLEFSRYKEADKSPAGFSVGRLKHKEEIDEINRIYSAQRMVAVDPEYLWQERDSDKLIYVIARQEGSGRILGVAMGVDHKNCFDDIMNGSSLWALAVDPQADLPGVGDALVRYLIEHFRTAGRDLLDLSVMHDNESAIRLYEKLGFQKVAVFAVKRCNPINEQLFVKTPVVEGYNPYATLIIKEALRRGINVEPIDPACGFFRLGLGGRLITCRESLSELTSAIAFTRCDDKQLTRQVLEQAGLSVPPQRVAGDAEGNAAFLDEHQSIVVKPAHGEQGTGVCVDIRTLPEMNAAIHLNSHGGEPILLEKYVRGADLRIIVINHEVVAAAVRKPAEVVGTGDRSVRQLIENLSRRRSAATGGESTIPLDEETVRTIEGQGYSLDSKLPESKRLLVRKTANLHSGGTIHDVTADLHPRLAEAAVAAAHALEIPLVGLDFIVTAVDQPDYVIIEANERPGLANHEPQPTAEKFIDFLFPQTVNDRQPIPRK